MKMDDSMNHSSINNVIVDSMEETPESPEESGWTAYFEDFSTHREDSFCSGFDSCSLVSDAASFPVRKPSSDHHNNNHVIACSSIDRQMNLPKKLSFKKTRAKEISDDDSLEDTASSPVNSPKISDLRGAVDMNPRKINDHSISSLGIGGSTLDNYGGLVTDARCDFGTGFDVNNNQCTELKKRGLCLVPLSVFANYLG
ncbi:hypothetical protein K2173_018726 [Erythroxylum novogranatense]|uniref:Uncharacterized protein n=1 Tax=Erythroxylum novogranatense TaxID=1862640 RepID=A0AAV8SAL3_9ROSI|nr:hypothetical protein K2173_018726 [Erythroxylum novogranatense]